MVEKIDHKMIKIMNTIRGMDKRMSYNVRLLGTVITPTEKEAVELPAPQEPKDTQNINKEIMEILKDTSVWDRKNKIQPKVKKLTDFVEQKLDLTTKADRENIELMKEKLRSVDH